MRHPFEELHKQCKRGRPTSYSMQDPDRVFGELGLQAGHVFLDVGCGLGDYSLHGAQIVGPSGHVYALDQSTTLVSELQEQVNDMGMAHLTALCADVTQSLPIQDGCVDVCLIATVLHIPQITRHVDRLFAEIRRVLAPSGRVTIIECSCKDLSVGPPKEMRLDPRDIEIMAAYFGFRQERYVDLGFNYLVTLTKNETRCSA